MFYKQLRNVCLRIFLNDVIVLFCHIFNDKEFQISRAEYLKERLPVFVCVTCFCKSNCGDDQSVLVSLRYCDFIFEYFLL